VRLHAAIVTLCLLAAIIPPAFATENADTAMGDVSDTRPMPVGNHCTVMYPSIALQQHMEGITVLGFTIAIDGSVKNLHVAKSSGHDILDQQALKCAARWRYKPATSHGIPVEVPWTAQHIWTLP
jgi:TonB family protein